MSRTFIRVGVVGILGIALSGCTGEVLVPVSAASWFNFDRRNAGAVIDDQAITVKANVALTKDRALWKDSHISTLSYNGNVLLVGQTKSVSNKAQAEKIVAKVSGVKSIYNQITVNNPIPMKARSNDTWLTTQVKARIMSNRNVGINRVKVISEDSIVYLMGKLTKDEETCALDIARRVPGVKKVVTVIEREKP